MCWRLAPLEPVPTLEDFIAVAGASEFDEIARMSALAPTRFAHLVKPVLELVICKVKQHLVQAENDADALCSELDQYTKRLNECVARSSKLTEARHTRAAGAAILREAEGEAGRWKSAKQESLREAKLRTVKLGLRLKLLEEMEPLIHDGDVAGVRLLQQRLPDVT